jgi:hypothetical protein
VDEEVNGKNSLARSIVWVVLTVNLLAASFFLVLEVGRLNNSYVPALQNFYRGLDRSGAMLRLTLDLLITLTALYLFLANRASFDRLRWIDLGKALVLAALGVLLSAMIFYPHSCCDNPVVLYLGFPMSWTYFATIDWHYLRMPAWEHLLFHSSNRVWHINAGGLGLTWLFWVVISGLIVTKISFRKDVRLVERDSRNIC